MTFPVAKLFHSHPTPLSRYYDTVWDGHGTVRASDVDGMTLSQLTTMVYASSANATIFDFGDSLLTMQMTTTTTTKQLLLTPTCTSSHSSDVLPTTLTLMPHQSPLLASAARGQRTTVTRTRLSPSAAAMVYTEVRAQLLDPAPA